MSRPHPNNAPGDFFVGNNECIACGAPEQEAPDLMSHVEGEHEYHCYFVRQPSTSEEIEQAINAIHVSCCRSVYYGGTDEKIIARLTDHGSHDCCINDIAQKQDLRKGAQPSGLVTKLFKRLFG